MPDSFLVYDFDPNNIPSEYLEAIGRVALSSAQTEGILGDFISGLLSIDLIENVALTAHMPNQTKLKTARALVELNMGNPAIIDTADDILDEIESALKLRNPVLHNRMAINPETQDVVWWRESAHGNIKVDPDPANLDQLEKAASRLYLSGLELSKFMTFHNIAPADRTLPIYKTLDRKKSSRKIRAIERRNLTR